MSSFVARPPATAPGDDPADLAVISNDGFFPDLDPVQLREMARVTSSVPPARWRAALVGAMLTCANDLDEWADQQRALGRESLADVPAKAIDGISRHVHAYQRAIGCFAKAEVIERYRDFDTTGAGGKAIDEMEGSVGQLRRDATHAIRDILGRRRTTVEAL